MTNSERIGNLESPAYGDDWDWTDIQEGLQEDCRKNQLSDVDLFVVWKMGLAAFLKARELGVSQNGK
jgi:hypothetical protein